MQRHAALLSRIEQQFGVPPHVDRRDLGAGDRFRRRRHGQAAGHPRRRHHGARLPPHRAVPGRAARRAEDPAARRPAAARPDRRLCRRDRPDPVPAVVLHQVRRRLRRQRPCRSAPQRAGRARLDGQSAQDQRLAGRRRLRRGHGEFRGDARVEPERGVSQDHRAVRRSARADGNRCVPAAPRYHPFRAVDSPACLSPIRTVPRSDELPRDARLPAAASLSDVPAAPFRGHLQHQSLDGPEGLGRRRRRVARGRAPAMGCAASRAHRSRRRDRDARARARPARPRLHRQRRRRARRQGAAGALSSCRAPARAAGVRESLPRARRARPASTT